MTSAELFLEQLRDGQPDAINALVTQYEASIYRFFLAAHRDPYLAQEQTTETFVQLVRALPTMRGRADKLRAFVFGVARRVQQRSWRDRCKIKRELVLSIDIQDPRMSPSDELLMREQLEKVLAAIGRLEQPLRQVLLLRFVEECSLTEIAEALEMPVGSVKSHIHRGRALLRRLFEEQECHE